MIIDLKKHLDSASVDAECLLWEAASEMKRRGVHWLLVYEDDKVAGVLSDRDIVLRGVARGADPSTTKVKELMTPLPEIAGIPYHGKKSAEEWRLMLVFTGPDQKVRGAIPLDGNGHAGAFAVPGAAHTSQSTG